jgi:hypothetical protein
VSQIGPGGLTRGWQFRDERTLTGVRFILTMTPMVKTQIYLRAEELEALHAAAERSGRSVADLVRDAIRQVWLRNAPGPVAIWDGRPSRPSVDHDGIYDEP